MENQFPLVRNNANGESPLYPCFLIGHESSMAIAFSLRFLQGAKTGHTVTTVAKIVVGVKTLLPVTGPMVSVLLVLDTSNPLCAKVISLSMTLASG